MSWLLANTAAAAALTVLVLAVGRWFRPAPAVMHGLWLIVLLKLVTPPLFEVPVDPAWWTAPQASPVVIPLELGEVGVPATVERTPTVASVAPPEIWPAPFESTSTSFWLVLWAAASMLFVLITLGAALRGHRRQRALPPASPALRAEVERLARRMSVRVPQLREDPHAAGPYIWSLGRAALMLPGTTLQSCTEKGRAAVLAHELAHIKRGDHWVARGEVVLAALLWWHPLFWFARSRVRLWAELACDAIAISTVPDASLDYATVLVDAAARPAFTDSTVPGLAVLASRPAARAAFERRLLMILNDKLPRRVSPIWCVPFATLALGLFAMPVAAQQKRETGTVQIEIRINGEPVKNLSAKDRQALLEVLLRQEKQDRDAREEGVDRRVDRRVERRAERRPESVQEPREPKASKRTRRAEGAPSTGELRSMINEGLAEARREIAKDKDLRELGITDEVLGLIDGLADGEGLESSLDAVVRAALKGAGKMVVREIESDSDLQELGIADGVTKLVEGFLANERNLEMVEDLAHEALKSAVGEVKHEIRSDSDLERLGITKDVERLLDTVITGKGSFEGNLERLIEKAMQGAMREIEHELRGAGGEAEPPKKEQPRIRRSRRVVR